MIRNVLLHFARFIESIKRTCSSSPFSIFTFAMYWKTSVRQLIIVMPLDLTICSRGDCPRRPMVRWQSGDIHITASHYFQHVCLPQTDRNHAGGHGLAATFFDVFESSSLPEVVNVVYSTIIGHQRNSLRMKTSICAGCHMT
jgi:hypothetical protein